MRILRWLAALTLLMMAPAYAQSTLLQAGPITPGHAPMYANSGSSQAVVLDSGPAGGGLVGLGMNEGLYVARGTGTAPYVGQGTGPNGTNWCDYDAPITNATGYHYLCMSANVGNAALITVGAGGLATPEPLNISLNGSVYQFPFAISGIVGPATTTIGHLATWANATGTLLQDSTTLPNGTTATTQITGDATTKVATDAFVGATQGLWQVPVHSVPIGLGSPNVGFNNAATGVAGQLLIDQGASADPAFEPASGSCKVTASGVFACQSVGAVTSYGASGSALTTTGTIGSSSASLALTASSSFVNGQGILVNHAGTAFSGSVTAPSSVSVTPGNSSGGATTYCYQLASVDNAGGVGIATTAVCTSAGVAVLGNHNAASTRSYNAVGWTPGTNATYTAIWRNTSGGAYCLLGEFTGTLIDDLVLPCQTNMFWLPATPTVAALADWLQTTVSAGGGTTSLTLGVTATTAASSTYVAHDDTAAIVAAMAANTGISFPCGTYRVTSLTAPNNLLAVNGGGKDCASIIGVSGVSTQLAGLNDPSILWTTWQFPLQFKDAANIGVSTLAPMAIGGIQAFGGFGAGGTNQAFHDMNVSGSAGVLCYNNAHDRFGPNIVVTNWWSYGIDVETCIYSEIALNEVQPMGGEGGGFYLSSPGLEGIGIASMLSSTNTDIIGNKVIPFGGIFGISNQSGYNTVSDNHVECSTHEGIAAAGTTASHSVIDGNYVFWNAVSTIGSTPAQCTSDDYGMSSANPTVNAVSYVSITNNYVSSSYGPGIEVTSNGNSFCMDHFAISGNTLIATGPALSSSVQLEGCVTDSTVGPNNFLNTLSVYDVAEITKGGTGNPARNFFAVQNGKIGTTGYVDVTATTSHYVTQPALVAGPASY